ncbi:MAG: efflux RND transporter periplasmic adaptor subunit [Chitinophagales bacterium]|nr:efflux RND transporter periplasmic adaptor subunit [Chitinophagales bacterium]
MKKFLKYSLILLLISAIGAGVYFLVMKRHEIMGSHDQKEVYTCSMHPEIRKNKPGNCPICGMKLIKLETHSMEVDTTLSENLLKPTDNFIVGKYQTITPLDTSINTELYLPGTVEYNPNSIVNIAARVSGRIEKMYVNYKFQKVNKGQKLFDIYSPELLTEQQNYIYLITNDAKNESLIAASKQKLMLYGITDAQLKSLNETKKTNPIISIYSPAYGIIQGTDKMTETVNSNSMQNAVSSTDVLKIKEGDYIQKGAVVFKLSNTDKVWAVFNVLQGYGSIIKLNQTVVITTEINDSEPVYAKIDFIETQLNQSENSLRVRVYLNNSKLKLPVGLRLQGTVRANPVKALWLPKQAMVSIGTKKMVFVKLENGFKAREINTGITINNYIQILKGITKNDTVAANAQYLIDSESFIKTR